MHQDISCHRRNEQLKMIQGLACLTRDDVQRQTQVAVVLSAVQARHVIDKLWNMQVDLKCCEKL